MPVNEARIDVSPRELNGRRALKQLRGDLEIPGIFYAADLPAAAPFKVSRQELQRAMSVDALIYRVQIAGSDRHAVIKAVQYHPVTDVILHVDLLGIRLDETIVVKIPVHLEGIPVGVKDEGGQLLHGNTELEIRCLASAAPTHVDVEVSGLHLGEVLHAGQLDIGDAELVTSPDAMIASVVQPRKVVEEVAVAPEEVEFEAEEGAEAPPTEAPGDDAAAEPEKQTPSE